MIVICLPSTVCVAGCLCILVSGVLVKVLEFKGISLDACFKLYRILSLNLRKLCLENP